MIKAKIENLLKQAVGKKAATIEVFPPDNEKFGHYSTNIALKMAKIEKANPLLLAEKIVKNLNEKSPKNFFEKIEIVAPGFINFWLSEKILSEELKSIIKKDKNYGKSDTWKNKKAIVEFTDPNPFKEFHIGHLYSNIVGETLARIFEKNGAKVKRANYQGDVGMHVAKAIWGMMKKMKSEDLSLAQLSKQTLDHKVKFMGESYSLGAKAFEEDEKAKLEITDLNRKIFALDKEIKDIYIKGRKWSLEYFEKIYKRLGVKFDFYYLESKVAEIGAKLVRENLKKGIFEISEGAVVFPGEKYGLHRRVFINSNGLPTYEAKELGLAPTKFKNFPYDISIIVTGNEIIDYFKVLLAALNKINPKLAKRTKHITHGMIRLPSGKMSSRTGDVIKAEDLLEKIKIGALKTLMSSKREKITKSKEQEVAEMISIGAVKYSLLKASLGSDIIFDFEKSLSFEGDSGPYLQYTYARLKSILRKAGHFPSKTDFMLLKTDSEKSLIRQLIYFPEVIVRAAETRETNIITEYLFKLATAINYFYEKEPILKVLKLLRGNRLNLIHAATIVLKNGLEILGIKTPEKM
ncbi:MAG: arginine--tRNA ligase [Candidatus Wolfebacteria bacterium]|nr:arginine--tRNA ligase [Candidatus Wolfebacteria bacterium]